MESPTLPDDFKEFLKLLNEHRVDYLLIGGYAVGIYGYPRSTADMDVWVGISPQNAEKLVRVFHAFGMTDPAITRELFQQPGNIVRMGIPPMRIEVLNQIDGVEFDACRKSGGRVLIDGLEVPLISLEDLKTNKQAAGRFKDLDDLQHLP